MPCLTRELRPRDFDGRIAQLVEQLTLNQRVHGSSPCAPTIEINDLDPHFTTVRHSLGTGEAQERQGSGAVDQARLIVGVVGIVVVKARSNIREEQGRFVEAVF